MSILNWNVLMEEDPQAGLDALYQQGAMQNQLGYEGMKQTAGFEEALKRIRSNPDYNGGYYKYTAQDLLANQKGEITPALKTAMLIAQEAKILGIPLEEYDPDNPTLNPMFANNEYDAKRMYEGFDKNIPNEFRIANNPMNDKKNIVSKVFNNLTGKTDVDKIVYDKSKENAVNAMMAKGYSGKQIQDILDANELYNDYTGKDKSGFMDINYANGSYNPKTEQIANQIMNPLDKILNTGKKKVKNEFDAIGSQFKNDMQVSADTLKRQMSPVVQQFKNDMGNSAQALDHQYGTDFWNKYFKK